MMKFIGSIGIFVLFALATANTNSSSVSPSTSLSPSPSDSSSASPSDSSSASPSDSLSASPSDSLSASPSDSLSPSPSDSSSASPSASLSPSPSDSSSASPSDSSSASPSASSSASPSASLSPSPSASLSPSPSTTPTQTPTSTPTPTETPTQAIRSDLQMKIENVDCPVDEQFKTDFKKTCVKLSENALDCEIKQIRCGSVIVEFYIVLNTTSEEEAANIVQAITKQIKSGKVGNYTTDPNFDTNAYITTRVKVSDITPAPDQATSTVSTELLIILGVALFVLLVLIITLVVLIFRLSKFKEKN